MQAEHTRTNITLLEHVKNVHQGYNIQATNASSTFAGDLEFQTAWRDTKEVEEDKWFTMAHGTGR